MVCLDNKGFWIVYITYIILFVGDITTTMLNTKLLSVLELNPLYRLTGSLLPIILLNLVFVYGFYWLYHSKKSSGWQRYLVILLMMVVIVMRLIAMNNALTWYNSPEVSVQEIEAVYTSEVMYDAQIYYAVLMYAPIIFCIITFLLWYWDHRVKRKEKEKNNEEVSHRG